MRYSTGVENDTKTITFLADEPDKFPAPTSAAQHVPDWLKRMPADVTVTNLGSPQSNSSLKRCMPFVDAMTCGYMIPLAGDVQFEMVDEFHINIVSPEEIVTWQNAETFPGAPFAQNMILKFRNPWIVQTPPGYSTLFVPVMNQMTMPFQILAGLVETDTYYNQVYFPAICLMDPGDRFELKRGTPIVQAIPIKRELWTSSAGQIDTARLAELKSAKESNPHIYWEQNWQKKSYR